MKQSRKTSLKTIAGLNGYTVTELARRVGKSRMNVYRAWKRPNSHGPTFRAMRSLLHITEVSNAN